MTSPRAAWRRRSLRLRLTVASTLLFALGMAAAGVLLTAYLTRAQLASLDDAARQRAPGTSSPC